MVSIKKVKKNIQKHKSLFNLSWGVGKLFGGRAASLGYELSKGGIF